MNDHREFAEAVALVADGSVEIPVERTFAFEEYPDALAALAQGGRLGKLVCNR